MEVFASTFASDAIGVWSININKIESKQNSKNDVSVEKMWSISVKVGKYNSNGR